MKKRTWIAASVLVVLVGGGLTLKKRLAKPSKFESVIVRAAEADIEEKVDATGSVAPENRVEIKPAMSGRVEKLIAEEGQRVRQGQLIAWMSSTDRAAILDGARAQGPEVLKHWQDAYKATPIFSPLPGLIILRNVVDGQTVDPSVVIYAMSDRLIVVAQVDESDIGRIHLGMPVRVVLDSYPKLSATGKVFDILYEGKNVSNVIQYPVKIHLDAVPDYYRSQMTANISFLVRKKEKALLVPASAVRDVSGVKQVFVPSANGKEETREVKTGIENEQSVEIVSGLKPGDEVVLHRVRYVPQQAAATSPLTQPPISQPTSGRGQGRRGRGP